jgi:hypothetical protein
MAWLAVARVPERGARIAMDRTWPTHRVSLGEDVRVNGPALYGAAGMSYYSSSMSEPTAEVLTSLGLGWTSFGRGMAGTTDPGATPLLAISETVDVPAADPLPAAFPMIRPLPDSATIAADPFQTRNNLYGVPVYSSTVSGTAGVPTTITCPTGSLLQGWAPEVSGTWLVDGAEVAAQSTVASEGSLETRAAVQTLGRTDGGAVSVDLEATEPSEVTLSCLQPDLVDEAVTDAPTPSELEISGSRMVASWAEPPGEVVVATAYNKGWRCSEGPTRSVGGLFAVDLEGATSLECRFVPAEFVPGAVATLVALLVLVVGPIRRRLL